jgi:hypothetical protein
MASVTRPRSQEALKRALDELKNSERKLRQVIDTIPTLAWCNLPDGLTSAGMSTPACLPQPCDSSDIFRGQTGVVERRLVGVGGGTRGILDDNGN